MCQVLGIQEENTWRVYKEWNILKVKKVIRLCEILILEGVHKNSHDCFLRMYPEKEQSAIIRAEINPKFN